MPVSADYQFCLQKILGILGLGRSLSSQELRFRSA